MKTPILDLVMVVVVDMIDLLFPLTLAELLKRRGCGVEMIPQPKRGIAIIVSAPVDPKKPFP